MWQITLFNDKWFRIGGEGITTTLTQAIAELIYMEEIKSIDEIREIFYFGLDK
jgi:hypothetical protein